MKTLSNELIERTWDEVIALDTEQAASAMMEFSEAQPELTGFVMAFLEEVSEDAREMGVFLTFLVYRVFQGATTQPIAVISETSIKKHYEQTQDFLTEIEDQHPDDSVIDLADYLDDVSQPNLYRNVLEVLSEEGDDGEQLSDEDFGEVFTVIKTAIDAIDAQAA